MVELGKAIGKVFRKDRYSSLWYLGADGNVWLISQSGSRSNHGSVQAFREKVKLGRVRFVPFDGTVESDLVRSSRRVLNWE